MSQAKASQLPSAIPGEAISRCADPHGRPGQDPAAFLARPRPAERALGTDTLALQLAFDSFREPVPAGHRGGFCGDRHLVYVSSEYAVDVQLPLSEDQPGILRGELLSRSDGPMARVPAFLLEGDEIAGYDRTGQLGEFELATGGATELRICLLLDAEHCITLPIAMERGGGRAGSC